MDVALMFPTFTPPRNPDPGMGRKPESRLLEADFGDGYIQATLNGINAIRDVITLTWSNLTQAEADAMMTFWRTTGNGGANAFLYQPPGFSSPAKWTWKDYSQDIPDAGDDIRYTITATLRQSFNLQ